METSNLNSLLHEYSSPDQAWSVVFDDNGQTGYAYLLARGQIVSDVWLYNRGPAPMEPPWKTRPNSAPYENPRDCVSEAAVELPASSADIHVTWEQALDGSQKAVIVLRGQPIGILSSGTTPGWSRLATKESPVARVMDEMPSPTHAGQVSTDKRSDVQS